MGRTFHTASCLVDPAYVACGEGLVAQKLLVLWGKGDDNKHCQDSWLLDVKSMTWSEVCSSAVFRCQGFIERGDCPGISPPQEFWQK